MYVTGIHFCWLGIFTEEDEFFEKILIDSEFFNEKILPKLIVFYYYSLLPEIVLENVPKKKDIIDFRQEDKKF